MDVRTFVARKSYVLHQNTVLTVSVAIPTAVNPTEMGIEESAIFTLFGGKGDAANT